MSIQELPGKLARAVNDPGAAARWLRRQIVGEPPKAPPGPRNLVAATLEQRLAEIRKAGHRCIAVYGDRATFEAVKAALPGVELTWFSGEFADATAGARTLSSSASGFDAFLIADGDVPAGYRQAVRWMSINDKPLPAYWVSNRFEFCAGTLPVAADCDDADIDIFNHFSDFLGQREALLLRVEVFDQNSTVTRWVVLRPRAILRIRLSEWLPDRKGPACVFHHCAHPSLTFGRHYRWRATGHLYWHGSAAMLHGDGDFRGPEAMTEHKIGFGTMRGGRVVFSLPNYHQDVLPDGVAVQTMQRRAIRAAQRRSDARIDEIAFSHDGPKAEYDEFFAVKFRGYGGSYWFALDEASGGDTATISANHSVNSMIVPAPRKPATPEAAAFVRSIAAKRILLDPHPVPVEPATSPIEFGFEFDMNQPVLRAFDVHAFDSEGKPLGNGRYEKRGAGAVFAGEIIDALGFDREKARLLLVSPDWIVAGADPRGRGAAGNLVVRLRSNGDYETTEFQNCWRNLGLKIGALPHWLSQDRMLSGRTNVMCGICADPDIQVGISCVNGSGNLDYADRAEALIRLVAPDGSEIQGRARVGAFVHRLLWLDELIPAWRRHLAAGYGTVIVQSPDADLNNNLVTIRGGRSVTLQHLWGY